ncbi:phosphatase PAP2 family protein [Pelomonas sp. KK5]|uniref:phosphatase PAP2 family protein n=1 Tax=Pelomonas sp. KK5 TaxID=1855730 RepID=UPI00097CA831|nr:phosphatase PAP2 family protein [Pelomonas sp. KK5]
MDIKHNNTRFDFGVALVALALLLAWDASGLDLLLVRHWADAAGFPWRERWITARVLHEGGRMAAWGVAAVLLVNIWKPVWPEQTKRERIWWLAATLVCVLVIPMIKRVSTTSCPWDQAEFGGVAQYVSHWRFGVLDGGPGKCFPSGHASSAFAFLSGYFALRRAYPRGARAWLLTTILIGAVFGFVQMIRGAHYASHTMWTAWVCWVVCAVGARIWLTPRNS